MTRAVIIYSRAPEQENENITYQLLIQMKNYSKMVSQLEALRQADHSVEK